MATFDRSVFRREPSQEDIVAANDQIHQHEAAITTIHNRVRMLFVEIADLRKVQAEHSAAVSYCRGVITLARRIPEELLSKIFEHCVEEGWTRAPIVVSHVCSAWRKAARAPRVWSRVYVECDAFDVLARTRFWLSMACQAPLDITIVATWRVHHGVITEIMDLLVQHVLQWRSLTLDTDYVSQNSSVFEKLTGVVPNLETVEIKTEIPPDDGDGEAVMALTDVLGPNHAPKLKSLRFICNILPSNPIFPAHIRELTLQTRTSPPHRPLSTVAILSLLENLTALQMFTLIMPLDYEHLFLPAPDLELYVVLPRLTSLTIYGPTDLNEVLPHFRTPILQQLHLRSLEDLGYRQRPIGPSLARFLASSTPPLELFELYDVDLTPDAFAACFAALPTLCELRLHESSISDATVRLLHGPAGLCPHLTRLDLRWCGHLSGAALVDLVRSRSAVDARGGKGTTGAAIADPISEIAVISCCFVKEQDITNIAQMAVCRVVMRDGYDYCRARECCANVRYRTRLRLRLLTNFSMEERSRIRLVV
ncbi:hypothetical protein B0H21DRAFT_22428 [Amylocystis lapponica]|nr:hypothetical protein B0H21DRAFT_22428 [Amylocystis lapponica]